MFDTFNSEQMKIIDKHIPLKQLSRKDVKHRSKPWITSGIKTSLKIKNNLYKKYIKSRTVYYHQKFKLYRNKINRLIKISKKDYYNKYFMSNKSNMKNIWKGIKQIINSKPRGSSSSPSKILEGENVLTDSKSIANAFNNFFANIGNNLATSMPSVEATPMDSMSNQQLNSIFLNPITSEEIILEINKLNSSKAVGPFSIPINILKLTKDIISKPLEIIFNSSLLNSIVPDSFKIARIIPIHKKGSTMSLDNYRPISLLSVFNELLGKLMFKRINKFISKHNILHNKQFGFRSKHSALHAILSITDKIQTAVEDGYYSCGIFLDLSKAFDTVNHSILLQKLEYYGFRGVAHNWLKSYLDNRKKFVTVGSISSGLLNISCGVPQGSVLGPLLFLLYINDIQNSTRILDFHLFADDSNLFYANKSLLTLETIVNKEISHVYQWLCANKLSLNVEKSNYIIFHPAQKTVNYQVKVSLNGQILKQEIYTTYLGVVIDCHLNWKAHISKVSKKIKRNIGAISRVRHFVDSNILINLYYALVYPYLIYGLVAWGNIYSSSINPLYILQKKVVTLMTFSIFYEHSNPLFIKLGILKLHDLVFYHNAIFMYDFHNDSLIETFNTFFFPVNQRHNYNTRLASRSSYSLPHIRTNYGKFNIRYIFWCESVE